MHSLRCRAELDDLGWEKSSGSAPKATCDISKLGTRAIRHLIDHWSQQSTRSTALTQEALGPQLQTQSKTSFGSNLITLF